MTKRKRDRKMAKQFKKERPPKPNKHEKICERCGNGGITRKKVFRCKFCNYINGLEGAEVEITRGGIDER